MCRQGLVRSVGLADVLKLHFDLVDVLPIGHFGNSEETKNMLFAWADFIIVMEAHYTKHVPDEYSAKTLICEVGPDVYGHSHNPKLIDMVWRWARTQTENMGIHEHFDKR